MFCPRTNSKMVSSHSLKNALVGFPWRVAAPEALANVANRLLREVDGVKEPLHICTSRWEDRIPPLCNVPAVLAWTSCQWGCSRSPPPQENGSYLVSRLLIYPFVRAIFLKNVWRDFCSNLAQMSAIFLHSNLHISGTFIFICHVSGLVGKVSLFFVFGMWAKARILCANIVSGTMHCNSVKGK